MIERKEKRETPQSLHRTGSTITPTRAVSQLRESQRPVQRWLALVILLICVTLGMLTSLLFLASRHEPTKMMEILRLLLAHVSVHGLMIGGSVIVAIGIIIVAAFIGLALSIVNALVRPKRNDHFIPLTPFALDLPAEEVTFSPQHGDYLVRGIYIARQDATTTVLVSPGYRRTFLDVLGMCKHLWTAGHNVLAFEYYGHGAVVGVPITLGHREVNDFLGAVSYARQRAPLARIGAFGYSMGGAVTIMGSVQTPEVLAVVADSAFASHWSAVEMAVRQTFRLPQNTFMVAMNVLHRVTDSVLVWRAGYHFHQVEPWQDIARLAPRPILLIHGLGDTVVHPDDSVRLYEAAGAPKALWHLPGTEHIKGYFTDGVTYTARVLNFFDRYLKQPLLTAQESTLDQEQATIQAEQEYLDTSLSEIECPPLTEPLTEPSLSAIPEVDRDTEDLSFGRQAAIEQNLMQILSHILVLPPGQVQRTGDFFEYGGDSESLDALLSALEQQWHIGIEANDIFDHPVVLHLATVIAHRQRQEVFV